LADHLRARKKKVERRAVSGLFPIDKRRERAHAERERKEMGDGERGDEKVDWTGLYSGR
jgi:hypothetical protein